MTHTTSTIAYAQRLHHAGWATERIRSIIGQQTGHTPSWATVRGWVDPKYGETLRARDRDRQRRRWRRTHPGAMPQKADDSYIAEQSRRLGTTGMGSREMLRVMRALYGVRLTVAEFELLLEREWDREDREAARREAAA